MSGTVLWQVRVRVRVRVRARVRVRVSARTWRVAMTGLTS